MEYKETTGLSLVFMLFLMVWFVWFQLLLKPLKRSSSLAVEEFWPFRKWYLEEHIKQNWPHQVQGHDKLCQTIVYLLWFHFVWDYLALLKKVTFFLYLAFSATSFMMGNMALEWVESCNSPSCQLKFNICLYLKEVSFNIHFACDVKIISYCLEGRATIHQYCDTEKRCFSRK